MPRARWSKRLVAAASIAVLIIGGLAIKLAYLQVTDGAKLAGMARDNTMHRVVLEADRGIIYDRHGAPLVANSPIWNLEVVRAGLPFEARARTAELAELARLTGEPEEKIAATLVAADAYAGVRIGPDLSQVQQLAIKERRADLAGGLLWEG